MDNVNPKKAHVWVWLGSGTDRVKVKALLDTGNTIKEETAITQELHHRLNVGLEKIGGIPIGTANRKGPKLEKLGISNLIPMEIDGIKGKFQIKPAVISTLSDSLNIGTGFLASVGKVLPVKLEFDRGTATLTVGNMQTELIRQMESQTQKETERVDQEDLRKGRVSQESQDHANEEPTVTRGRQEGRLKVKYEEKGQTRKPREKGPSRRQQVYAGEERVCSPNSITFVEAVCERPLEEVREALIEDDEMNQTETVQAMYKWKKKGNKIAVINHASVPICIKKHSSLGFIAMAEVDQEKDKEQTQSYLERISNITDEHRMQVIEDLGLMTNPVLKANPEIQKKAIKLVMEYADIFGEKGKKEMGLTDLVEFEIDIKPGTKPVKQKVRPLNPHQKESLKKQIETWTREEVIEPVVSPWASPLVPAKKAGGCAGEIRWAVDYRILNSATITDSYPIPNIDEVLERLAGSRYFSALDAAAAYHTIPVAKKARPLLAFTTPYGLFTFTRMPFGPTNSGACYARFVDMLLQKIRSQHVVAYIDDILIFTNDLEKHLKEMEQVFQLHRYAGIKLRPKKTDLFTEKTKYLGFDVSRDGIRMRRSYVDKILDWPVPKTTKQLRTFLGFTSYYRSFIKDYSELTCEMNGVRMGKDLEWTEEMDFKFKELKKRFEKMPLRSYPRYDIPEKFKVTTDWSQKNMAGILSQIQEGLERFIAAHGRKCSKHEQNYPSTKGELAAIMACLRKWDHILKYRPFELYTDSKALKYLQTLKQPKGIWFRWLEELQGYNFTVHHKPGKENTNADNLSRCDHLPEATPEEAKEAEEEYLREMCTESEEDYIKNLYEVIGELDEEDRIRELVECETDKIREMHDFGSDVTPKHVAKAQKQDPIVATVRSWVQEGKKPDKQELKGQGEELQRFAQLVDALEIKDDILYYRYKLNHIGETKTYRMVMPETIRNSVFYWAHQDISAGHFGQTATVLRAQSRFYYPGMTQDLKRKVSACGDCLVKKNKIKIRDGTHNPQKTGYPGQRVYIDLVGPLPVTNKQERYVLTVEDGFTRHGNAYPIRNKEATTVARCLIENYCSDYGFPEGIHSDNGKEFVNEVWNQLCDRLGIKKTTTPTYNPQSNIVERWHRTLNMMMRTFLDREDKEWSRYLPAMVMAYNTKVNSSTGVTPYFATFGREARLPVDLILPTPGDEPTTLNGHVEETLKRFNRIYAFIRQNNEAVIRRNAKVYTGKKHEYVKDEKVWYLCPRRVKGKPEKLTDMWLGPYNVVERVAEVLYTIKPTEYEGPSITVHAARLLPYRPGTTVKSRIPANLETDDQGDELAEEIRPPRPDPGRSIELGVPVTLGVPEFDIVDHIAGKRKGRPPKQQQSSSNQTEPEKTDSATSTEEPQMRPSQPQAASNAEDELSRKRGRAQNPDSDTDASVPEAKAVKLRPRRTHDEIVDQFRELKKRIEIDTGTESDQPGPKRQPSNIVDRARDLLYSSDEDIMSICRTLTVEISEESTEPKKGTPESACYDITTQRTEVVPAHGIAMIPLNLRMAIPPGYFCLLLSRSGLASKGITTLAGVIDSDYRGPVYCIIANSTSEDFVLKKGQRCTQGLFLPTHNVEFKKMGILSPTKRNNDGFGSTDAPSTDVPHQVQGLLKSSEH